MRWSSHLACSLITASLFASCKSAARPPAAASASQPSPAAAQADTVQEFNAARVREVLASISGRENEPAERVFKNVKQLGTTPARIFLTIMNVGYARALGVRCTHCHVERDYSSDDKRPKRAAREMAVMHRMINQELAKMDNLETPRDQNRAINCSTCHRGTVKPR
jgi:hypothetical protein